MGLGLFPMTSSRERAEYGEKRRGIPGQSDTRNHVEKSVHPGMCDLCVAVKRDTKIRVPICIQWMRFQTFTIVKDNISDGSISWVLGGRFLLIGFIRVNGCHSV